MLHECVHLKENYKIPLAFSSILELLSATLSCLSLSSSFFTHIETPLQPNLNLEAQAQKLCSAGSTWACEQLSQPLEISDHTTWVAENQV
jgi:hypothetical protein